MEYSQAQLDFIQIKLKKAYESMKDTNGIGKALAYADIATWASHANMAGYAVERDTGRMYKQKDNVRTYFKGED